MYGSNHAGGMGVDAAPVAPGVLRITAMNRARCNFEAPTFTRRAFYAGSNGSSVRLAVYKGPLWRKREGLLMARLAPSGPVSELAVSTRCRGAGTDCCWADGAMSDVPVRARPS